MISCRRAISDTTAPGAYDSATIRPLSSSLHRRRRPTPLRISTRPRGAVASTIWSTIYANRSCQHRSHLPNYAALRKMGAKHRLQQFNRARGKFARLLPPDHERADEAICAVVAHIKELLSWNPPMMQY